MSGLPLSDVRFTVPKFWKEYGGSDSIWLKSRTRVFMESELVKRTSKVKEMRFLARLSVCRLGTCEMALKGMEGRRLLAKLM